MNGSISTGTASLFRRTASDGYAVKLHDLDLPHGQEHDRPGNHGWFLPGA
jgi:hypothetical protein